MRTGLIVTVGTSSEPVVFSLNERRPDAVGFLLTNTPECRASFASVLAQTGLTATAYREREVNDSPGAIGTLIGHFYDLHAWLRDPHGGSAEQIACDPTAGRKWMSAGLAMIASRLGLEMFYVDVRYPGGKLDPASMRSVPLGNAFEQTGFLDALHAVDLFNDALFSEAQQIFERLACSASGALRPALYTGLARLAEAFHRMDLFEHHARDLAPLFEEAARFLNQVQKERAEWNDAPLEAARRLAGALPPLGLSAGDSKRNVLPRCADLWANARRRCRRGRYDDSVARLYRCFEALAQAALAARGFDSTCPNEGICRLDPALRDSLKAQLPPGPWALDTSWRALYLLHDPWAGRVVAKVTPDGRVIYKASVFGRTEETPGERRTGLEARNLSILAHGWRPISRATAERLLLDTERLLQELSGGGFAQAVARLAPPVLAKESVLL
jgi:CRISPR-associated protein (TIGR02710 family)